MSLEYKKQTDEVHEVKLDSKITNVNWRQKIATVGDKVSFFVQTHFVGNGSEIEIKVEDKKGKKIEKLKGLVFGDQFAGSIVIPEKTKEEISFTAKLPKHGLEMKSGKMIVFPLIRVSNMKWGQKEARREDIVKLSADIEGLPDEAEVMIIIYEYDQDGAHDFITKFPCRVKNKKIEAEWEYEYHEDTDEIPTQEEKEKYGENYNPPEYFFVIDVYRQRFGENQESDLLVFRDWIEVLLTNGPEEPIPDEPYILYLPDGNTKEGNTNNEGRLREENIPPGKVYVEFPGFFELYEIKDGHYELPEATETEEVIESADESDESSQEETVDDQSEQEMDDDSDEADDDTENVDEESEELIDDEYEGSGDFEDVEEYPDYDGEDVEEDESETFTYQSLTEAEYKEEYEVAFRHCVSGRKYHLAVVHYLSVMFLNEMNEPLKQSVDYQLRDRDGRIVLEGSSDDYGIIEQYGVSMGDYELIVNGLSVWISSLPDTSEKEFVILAG